MGIVKELQTELWNGENPFDHADVARYLDEGYPHTNMTSDLAEAVIDVCRPVFWLEIGSMLGGSIVVTANAIKNLNLSTEICCIDPFCGDVNMWAWEQRDKSQGNWRFLKLEQGRPTIYDRFLANLKSKGLDRMVVPIVTTSTVGMKLIHRLKQEGRISRTPDVIYLDSAHEPDETYLELTKAWELLSNGGILMGDDWNWDNVRNDVLRFASTTACNVDILNSIVQKLSTQEETIMVVGLGHILIYKGQWLIAK